MWEEEITPSNGKPLAIQRSGSLLQPALSRAQEAYERVFNAY
jgi:hypothetical protein